MLYKIEKYSLQFVKDKSIFYKLNNKTPCRFWRVYFNSDVCFVGFDVKGNVRYIFKGQNKLSKQYAAIKDGLEDKQANFILILVRYVHTKCIYIYLQKKYLLIKMGGVAICTVYPLL